MAQVRDANEILREWLGVLGSQPSRLEKYPERELWKVQTRDGREFYLKHAGPWRNLPITHEAQVLNYLANQGVSVAEFLPADSGKVYAGDASDPWVLMPRLGSEIFSAIEVLQHETEIGTLIARLHVALAQYPGKVDSYTEDLRGSMERELMLPPSLMDAFSERKHEMISALAELPTQLVHGDLTPENIVLSRPISGSGFIDFEHLPHAPRIWDVAKYLSRRLRMRWRSQDPSASHDRLNHLVPFLRGYRAIVDLQPEEVAALPSLIATANVIEVSYFMEIASGVLNRRMLSDHQEVLDDSIEAAAWHFAHWDEVVAPVTGG